MPIKKHTRKPTKKTRGKTAGLVYIGPLLGLMYQRDGKRYLHKFNKSRPGLYTNRAGDRMVLVGGRYRWTPLGVK